MKQISRFFEEFEKDISFYNQNTEIFLAWTIVFGSVVVIVLSTIERGVMVLVGGIFLSAVLLVLISLTTIYYLYSVSTSSRTPFLYKIHRFLNTSILIRNYLSILFRKVQTVFGVIPFGLIKQRIHLKLLNNNFIAKSR